MVDKGAYVLLRRYEKKSRIQSRAFQLNQRFFARIHRTLNYSLVVLTASATTFSAMDEKIPELQLVLTVLNLLALIVTGVLNVLKPGERQYASNHIASEFNELAISINQFIVENNKTQEEMKTYSQQVCEQLKIWETLAPTCKANFLKQAASEVEKAREITPPITPRRSIP
jgi:hypothetical protein